MREFEDFVSLLTKVEFLLLSSGLLVSFLFKGLSAFTFSFFIGSFIVFLDYLYLVRFSRRLPELVKAGIVPKSGFIWRYASILLILVGISLFTPLNFFAIISAVALSQLGLFISVLLFYKEWRRWKEAS